MKIMSKNKNEKEADEIMKIFRKDANDINKILSKKK